MKMKMVAAVLLIGTVCFGHANIARADDADDAYSCESTVFTEAAKAIGFAGGDDLWSDRMANACRYDPGHDKRIIVALTHLPGEEKTGRKSNDDSRFMRDLDVVILDSESHTLVAHTHESEAIEDGGDRLEGIDIDTARYMLAPGLRAFGVSVRNGTHCTCANSSDTALRLYMQHGNRIDQIGTVNTYSWQSGYETGTDAPPACTSTATTKKTVISVAKSSNHGLADLQLATNATEAYDFDEDPSKCPALKPTKTNTTLRFDGTTYR